MLRLLALLLLIPSLAFAQSSMPAVNSATPSWAPDAQRFAAARYVGLRAQELRRLALNPGGGGVTVGTVADPGDGKLGTQNGYQVAGAQVVSTQGAAVADASGGATVDTEARAALNALLARLRAHGLIAT